MGNEKFIINICKMQIYFMFKNVEEFLVIFCGMPFIQMQWVESFIVMTLNCGTQLVHFFQF